MSTVRVRRSRNNDLHTVRVRDLSAALFHAVMIGALLATGPAAAVELITPRDAALPDAPAVNVELGVRGVTRAPTVQILSPAPDAGQVRSPFNLLVKFEPHGGATIDPRSCRITYLKRPLINLTPRIGDAIKPDGIELDGAEAPPGTHYLKIEVKDSAGRTGSAVFSVMVGE